MSHEIRTPMNGILGFTALLQDKNLTAGELSEYAKIIEKSGLRMLNTINDIVDISKIESGMMPLNVKKTNLNDQIVYLYNFFKLQVEAKGLRLIQNCALNHDAANIYTDREKIFAIFTNLIKNALKFTHSGVIEFGYEKKDKELEFYVKDSGIGIADKFQKSIFNRFSQIENYDSKVIEGTGLGLAISKAYAEMLGGSIRLKSKPGKGSEFTFTLPYLLENPIEAKGEQIFMKMSKPNDVKRLNIVVADDDEISNYLLSILLRQKNHTVHRVSNGQEAVDFCRSHDGIDLILMDIRMPLLNGYQATEQIRLFNTNIIIIAQTAFGLVGDKEKAIAVGCDDYIIKPINQDKLFQLINHHCG